MRQSSQQSRSRYSWVLSSPFFVSLCNAPSPGSFVRSIFMVKNDYRLTHPPGLSTTILEGYADEATSYGDVIILVMPFFRRPRALRDSVTALSELGAHVVMMKPGTDGCPALRKRMDAEFQKRWADAIVYCIHRACPPRMAPSNLFSDSTEYQVAFDLLRGLASHDRMGPNNHSHEDDMWKNRGIGLQSNARHGIEKRLMMEGILGRKKNKSRGGTGWVYWIADVNRTVKEFPALRDIVVDTGTPRSS